MRGQEGVPGWTLSPQAQWAGAGPGVDLEGRSPLTGAPACCRKGLTFVSVHDCFWTHAADVAVMNQVPAPPSPGPLHAGPGVPASVCLWVPALTLAVRAGSQALLRLLPSQVCREQFVRLHSQPILHDLSRFLVERFCSGPR